MRKFTGFARKANGTLMSAGTGTWVAYLAGTTTPVTVYITDDTSDPVTDFTIPASGKIEFYARNGDIKVVATEGAETVTVDDVTMMAGLTYGALSGRPTAGSVDRLFIATDIGRLYYDDGSAWQEIMDFAKDAMDWYPADDVVAQATTNVFGGKGNYVEVTHASGTLAITALASSNAPEGSPRLVKFTISGGTLSLTHNATSQEIAGGADWALTNGALALVTGKGGSNVRVIPLDAGVALIAATQAEQEAGAAVNRVTTPGRQHFHPSAAKAWVNFNGTGTVAIRSSYNVSSITDNGTGIYTVNFTTAFSTANYGVAAIGRRTSSNSFMLVSIRQGVAPTAAALAIAAQDNAANLEDPTDAHVVCFGDQ